VRGILVNFTRRQPPLAINHRISDQFECRLTAPSGMVIAVHCHLVNRIDDILRGVCLSPASIAGLLSCALLLTGMSSALAVTAGPLSPATCTDVGGGDVAWNPLNSLPSKATVDANNNKPNTNKMRCTGYGFAIPAGATINGIIVMLNRHAKKKNKVTDLAVHLVKAGATGATNRATTTFWPNKAASENHGGAADLWGDTWTEADINAANFGAEIAAQAPDPKSRKEDANLDGVTITVVYNVVVSTTCGNIPSTYALYASGGLDPGTQGNINGNNITGAGNALQTSGALTTVGQTLPTFFPSTFPVNSSTTNIDTTTTNPVVAGNYDTVTLDADPSVFSGGTYNIKTLIAPKRKKNDTQTTQLAPGDYFIDTLDFENDDSIVVSPAGVVRIFVKTLLTVHDKADFNGGGATQNLQIYLYDGAVVDFHNKNVFNGLIYGPGTSTTIGFRDDTTLTGAVVTDGSLSFNKKLTANYSAATQTAIGSITTCDDVDNFLIDIGAVSASTCAPKNITITARDSSNNPILDYNGTVDISTSSSHGDWTLAPGFAGTLNNLVADDGAATYLYDAADSGVVTLSLSNSHADDLTITVVDPSAPTSSSTSTPLINFRDNVFVISPTDSLGTTAVAGRNHAFKAELWDRDLSTGNCSIDTKYTGNKNLDAWYAADVDHPAGASVPAISTGTPPASCGGAPVLALGASAPASNPALNNLNAVPFVNGVWNFCLATSDVGKYAISLRDDTRIYATGVDIIGASNALTVRPFGLAISGVQKGATPNPAGTATSGAKFVPAGNTGQAAATFEATVGGYLWNVADDADNDGVPDSGANITDNGLAARFSWPITLAAINTAPYFTPVGGALGNLTGTTSITTGSYAGGQATVSDLAYSEVGSFQMQGNVTNYLNSGINLSGVNVGAAGAPTQIGRFFPDHFTLLPASSLTAACLSGGFTYMGQSSLGVNFTVEARNTANFRTNNYGAGYGVGTVSTIAENNDDGVDLSARLSVSTSTWATGAYIVNTGTANFGRAAAPDGPYELLQLGIEIFDADMVVLAGRDMNPGTAGACGGACTAKLLTGNTKMRFGRLRANNASGATRLGLPLGLQAQYYTPFGFVTNGDDDCTSFSGTDIAMAFVTGTNLAACDTAAVPGGAVTLVNGKISGLQLAAPGIGNDGSVDLTLNLGVAGGNTCTAVGGPTSAATSSSLGFLQGNWGGTVTWDQDPRARATFGIYKNAAEFLYLQENY
jgi:hypothetical protein